MIKYNEHSSTFEKVLSDNFVSLLETPSVLIKCRIALTLGYFLDNLFMENNAHFLHSVEFLIKGLATEKESRALALQCADTLKTVIEDKDLIRRLESFINKLFPFLAGLVSTIELPSFFDILSSIITSYSESIDLSVIQLLISLVNRIEYEYKILRAKKEKHNMTINQCWNVIQTITSQNVFYPEFLDKIETALLPMFNYLVDPTAIEFDDHMVKIVAVLIEKKGSISENMGKIFPFLLKYFEKNKGVFGNLLYTLNCYIYYGKEQFAGNKIWLELVIRMGLQALFNPEPPTELNNAKGCLLLQILLQNIGNGGLDSYLHAILLEVLRRALLPPMSPYLAIQLKNVYLCALCNNADITLTAIEAQRQTENLFRDIIVSADKVKLEYNRKILIVGLSNLLTYPHLPPCLAKIEPEILLTIVSTLQKQTAEEEKKTLKTDKKVISLEDKSDSSSSDDDGEEAEMEDEDKTEEK